MKQSGIIAQGPTVQLRFLTIDDAQPMFETLSDEEAMRLTGTKENFSFSQVEAHCSNIQIAEDRADFGILAGGVSLARLC